MPQIINSPTVDNKSTVADIQAKATTISPNSENFNQTLKDECLKVESQPPAREPVNDGEPGHSLAASKPAPGQAIQLDGLEREPLAKDENFLDPSLGSVLLSTSEITHTEIDIKKSLSVLALDPTVKKSSDPEEDSDKLPGSRSTEQINQLNPAIVSMVIFAAGKNMPTPKGLWEEVIKPAAPGNEGGPNTSNAAAASPELTVPSLATAGILTLPSDVTIAAEDRIAIEMTQAAAVRSNQDHGRLLELQGSEEDLSQHPVIPEIQSGLVSTGIALPSPLDTPASVQNSAPIVSGTELKESITISNLPSSSSLINGLPDDATTLSPLQPKVTGQDKKPVATAVSTPETPVDNSPGGEATLLVHRKVEKHLDGSILPLPEARGTDPQNQTTENVRETTTKLSDIPMSQGNLPALNPKSRSGEPQQGTGSRERRPDAASDAHTSLRWQDTFQLRQNSTANELAQENNSQRDSGAKYSSNSGASLFSASGSQQTDEGMIPFSVSQQKHPQQSTTLTETLPLSSGGSHSLQMFSGAAMQNTSDVHPSDVIDRNNVISQLVDKVHLLSRNMESELVVSLKPEFLGRISLRATMVNDSLVTTLVAESAHAKALLESHLPALQQALQDQGLSAAKVVVLQGSDLSFLGSGFGQPQPQQHSRPRSWNSLDSSSPDAVDRIDKNEGPNLSPSPLSTYDSRSLNVMA